MHLGLSHTLGTVSEQVLEASFITHQAHLLVKEGFGSELFDLIMNSCVVLPRHRMLIS